MRSPRRSPQHRLADPRVSAAGRGQEERAAARRGEAGRGEARRGEGFTGSSPSRMGYRLECIETRAGRQHPAVGGPRPGRARGAQSWTTRVTDVSASRSTFVGGKHRASTGRYWQAPTMAAISLDQHIPGAVVHVIQIRTVEGASDVLLVLRANTGHRDGTWAPPAGRVEAGETLRGAAAREVLAVVKHLPTRMGGATPCPTGAPRTGARSRHSRQARSARPWRSSLWPPRTSDPSSWSQGFSILAPTVVSSGKRRRIVEATDTRAPRVPQGLAKTQPGTRARA